MHISMKDCQGKDLTIGDRVAYPVTKKFGGCRLNVGVVNEIKLNAVPDGVMSRIGILLEEDSSRRYYWQRQRYVYNPERLIKL